MWQGIVKWANNNLLDRKKKGTDNLAWMLDLEKQLALFEKNKTAIHKIDKNFNFSGEDKKHYDAFNQLLESNRKAKELKRQTRKENAQKVISFFHPKTHYSVLAHYFQEKQTSQNLVSLLRRKKNHSSEAHNKQRETKEHTVKK